MKRYAQYTKISQPPDPKTVMQESGKMIKLAGKYVSGKFHTNFIIKMGFVNDDFARNLITVIVENDVYKVPRFFMKLYRVDNRKVTTRRFHGKNPYGRSARKKKYKNHKYE